MIPKIKHELKHNLPQKEIKESYDILKVLFDEKWLNKDDNHPLQSLWHRDDTLAILELYSFGNSLITIKNIDPHWIKGKIRRIKLGDTGAIFEILTAAMFEKGNNHDIMLPLGDNPGYDLIVRFKDNSTINVSCKNHRRSNHRERFNKASKQFEKKFVYLCNSLNLNLQCIIISKIYPDENPHWNRLNKNISNVLLNVAVNGLSDKSKSYFLDNWIINVSNLSEYKNNLSNLTFSYNLVIMVPFHKNEFDNIMGHLNDAYDNLSQLKIDQNKDNINIIYVNFGNDYALDFIEDGLRKFLENDKSNYIAGIYFQKGYLTYELDIHTFQVNYIYRLIKTDYYDIWNQEKDERVVNLISPMGMYAKHANPKKEPETRMLSKKGEKIEEIDIGQNIYTYHNGEIYLKDFKSLKQILATPNIRIYWAQYTKNGPEFHYFNTPTEGSFILL